MQIINVQQGTPEWHALRSRHFTASEAPVMMAVSSKMRRDELLNMKATGSEREISDWVQTNLFDKGHAQEATARVIVESIIGSELFPATAIDDDGYLLASFDGMTMMEDVLFEHKMWNATLALAVKNKDLPPEYYWQLEQQLAVSDAEKSHLCGIGWHPRKLCLDGIFTGARAAQGIDGGLAAI
ncbi:TPA: YqaJ viral recombinase family protein [Yersinia enterocolitica]|nr:YqaJ viral recombinase family protein [Yersinia enterocolitica]